MRRRKQATSQRLLKGAMVSQQKIKGRGVSGQVLFMDSGITGDFNRRSFISSAAASDFDDQIRDEVINAILETNGENGADPSSLGPETKMSEFGFSDSLYITLTDKLNEIIKEHNPNADVLTVDQVMDAVKVKDLIALVEALIEA